MIQDVCFSVSLSTVASNEMKTMCDKFALFKEREKISLWRVKSGVKNPGQQLAWATRFWTTLSRALCFLLHFWHREF